jgi:hypothetical protein
MLVCAVWLDSLSFASALAWRSTSCSCCVTLAISDLSFLVCFSWYGLHCPLTGVSVLDAAYIVDVQAVKGMGVCPLTIWGYLRSFWLLEDLENFNIAGEELRNIRLEPTAHRLWDRNRFGLPPIPYRTTPTLYTSKWFNHYHNAIGLESAVWLSFALPSAASSASAWSLWQTRYSYSSERTSYSSVPIPDSALSLSACKAGSVLTNSASRLSRAALLSASLPTSS